MAPNAADPKQQRGVGRLAKKRERRYFDALIAVLSTPEGRLVFGEREYGLIARAGVNRSAFASDPIVMAHLTGRQDYGHELLALLTQADEGLLLTMEAETRGLAQRDAVDLEANAAGGEK